jgi:hypothetical protein
LPLWLRLSWTGITASSEMATRMPGLSFNCESVRKCRVPPHQKPLCRFHPHPRRTPPLSRDAVSQLEMESKGIATKTGSIITKRKRSVVQCSLAANERQQIASSCCTTPFRTSVI